jgi:general secretion pathway protein N
MDIRVTRMITLALAGSCGVLALSAMVQLAGYGRGYGWLPADTEPSASTNADIDRNPFSMPAFSSYHEVDSRPLFNEDRKPTPVSEGDAEEQGPPPVPLNVTLTGVILVRKTESTPELRIAMVRDNMRNESLALKVGMPLTGDQAGWTLVAVEPRLAKFRNASDELAEIELYPAAAAPAPPQAQRPPPVAPAVPGGVAPNKGDNAAESDLAKRIEERRRQMREEAERLRSQRGNSPSEQKN